MNQYHTLFIDIQLILISKIVSIYYSSINPILFHRCIKSLNRFFRKEIHGLIDESICRVETIVDLEVKSISSIDLHNSMSASQNTNFHFSLTKSYSNGSLVAISIQPVRDQSQEEEPSNQQFSDRKYYLQEMSFQSHEGWVGNMAKYYFDLWRVAKRQSDVNGNVVLLLVTRGYEALFRNFLCSSMQAIRPTNQEVLPFVVITNEPNVVSIAKEFNLGFFSPDFGASEEGYAVFQNASSADFGTILYQKFMLFRTKCALDILKMGFKPLIADIDTVWLANPLKHLSGE